MWGCIQHTGLGQGPPCPPDPTITDQHAHTHTPGSRQPLWLPLTEPNASEGPHTPAPPAAGWVIPPVSRERREAESSCPCPRPQSRTPTCTRLTNHSHSADRCGLRGSCRQRVPTPLLAVQGACVQHGPPFPGCWWASCLAGLYPGTSPVSTRIGTRV